MVSYYFLINSKFNKFYYTNLWPNKNCKEKTFSSNQTYQQFLDITLFYIIISNFNVNNFFIFTAKQIYEIIICLLFYFGQMTFFII